MGQARSAYGRRGFVAWPAVARSVDTIRTRKPGNCLINTETLKVRRHMSKNGCAAHTGHDGVNFVLKQNSGK